MRVLYCTELLWPHIGGAEIMAARFLSAMQERGHEFVVATSHSGLNLPDSELVHGTPVHRFRFHHALTDRRLDRLMAVQQQVAELRRAVKPELVHLSNIGADAFFHLHTASACHAPTLVTLHGLPMVPFSGRNGLVGRVLHSADWVAAVSRATLDEARRAVPEITPRSSTIHNGLSMPPVRPDPLSFDPPRLLCLGRLVPHKGFDLALAALAALTARFPQARLTIAGDGPARVGLEQQVIELGLADVVDFIGRVPPDEVPALINASTAVVMPSRREPFGLVALQTAQMARPIVATRVGGLPEVVVHGSTGLLVNGDDVAALAEGIALLLDRPQAAARMGQAARRRAQTRFGLARMVDAYDALYRGLASAWRE